jgi:hypothetical protein
MGKVGVLLQVDGHSYIDTETLAQITNESVKFEPNQIVEKCLCYAHHGSRLLVGSRLH